VRVAFEFVEHRLQIVDVAGFLDDRANHLSAWANDVGYHSVFTLQLSQVLVPGDVVVAFSASGKSPNILAAVELARSRGAWLGLGSGGPRTAGRCRAGRRQRRLRPVEGVHLLLNHLSTTVRRVPRSMNADRTRPSGGRTGRVHPRLRGRRRVRRGTQC
jgi:hypothetical protein